MDIYHSVGLFTHALLAIDVGSAGDGQWNQIIVITSAVQRKNAWRHNGRSPTTLASGTPSWRSSSRPALRKRKASPRPEGSGPAAEA